MPPSLAPAETRGARAAASRFYNRRPKERSQQTHTFDAGIWSAPDVFDALDELFHGNCAYCETRGDAQAPLAVQHYRPRSGALAANGALSPDHYWWLAYDWENLLVSCPTCERMKGQRFPVAAKRAEPRTTGAALSSEQPLLLNPRIDDPTEYLLYLDDGTVVGRGERALTTIDILGLNRAELVSDRIEELRLAHAEWESTRDIERLLDPSAEFAAMRRQFAMQWAGKTEVTAVEPEAPPAPTGAEKRNLKQSYLARQQAQEQFSVEAEDAAQRHAYFARTRLIERIVIRNFRVIEELDLSLTPPATEQAPWLMLIGENGTGKSTILQAVALALTGERERTALRVDPAELVRHGTRSAQVEVYLSGVSTPLRLRISRTGFRAEAMDAKVLLLGYGATRLLPRYGATPPRDAVERVDNLFDPFVPIGDTTSWLVSLQPRKFDAVSRSLKRLLMLDDKYRLIRNRRRGRVEVEGGGDRIPLAQLSDGNQSIVALATDVMMVLLRRWETMDVAEGIVLVDELGAHLHPQWRMWIVPLLRAAFPRVQFIASTHDPLCLRGLGDGEVAVLRKEPDIGVYSVTDLPSIRGLRVDQLLTSEFFGLSSTVDPELDRLFKRYYELKTKPTLLARERREMQDLRAQLDEHQVLGTTRRERLVLEAADDFLARETGIESDSQREELFQDTKVKIRQLWDQVIAEREVVP
ncbi:MAG TPA: AAA family ATPase [Gaiellaceae bacterium]|nr:AAA family ATPase [Gaiellaceae bacterium]